jgi:hypothetical protein
VRRAAAAWLLSLGLACQSGPLPRPAALEVEGLALDLPEPGVGRLRLQLPLPAGEVSEVTWELALDGHRFATGVEAAPRAVDGGVALDVPLAWRHFGWREGPRWVRVEVRGQARHPGRSDSTPFRGARDVLVQGAPRLDAPLD